MTETAPGLVASGWHPGPTRPALLPYWHHVEWAQHAAPATAAAVMTTAPLVVQSNSPSEGRKLLVGAAAIGLIILSVVVLPYELTAQTG